MNMQPRLRVPLRHAQEVLARHRSGAQHRVADRITAFAGSMPFVYVHVLWFSAWIAVNSLGPFAFDPFPYGLLTLVVSLEAIFLSTFVLLSQNRETLRAEIRSELDFETNVLSEAWLEAVAARLEIDIDAVHRTAADRLTSAMARQSRELRLHQ